MMKQSGILYGVGVGPGDPDLITIKGLNAIRKADIVAFHQTHKMKSNALCIANQWLDDKQQRLALTYPLTTEQPGTSQAYHDALEKFYQETAKTLQKQLDNGMNIAVLTEGDPTFYSSFMYILDHFKGHYRVEIIPGVSSVFAAASALQTGLCYRNETFSVLSAVMDKEKLVRCLKAGDSFAIVKIGRNFPKLCDALVESGLYQRALYIERATMENQRIIPLSRVNADEVPYFSIVLVPGQTWRDNEDGGIK